MGWAFARLRWMLKIFKFRTFWAQWKIRGTGESHAYIPLRDKAWLSDYYYNNNQPFYFKRVGRLRKI